MIQSLRCTLHCSQQGRTALILTMVQQTRMVILALPIMEISSGVVDMIKAYSSQMTCAVNAMVARPKDVTHMDA